MPIKFTAVVQGQPVEIEAESRNEAAGKARQLELLMSPVTPDSLDVAKYQVKESK